jgi:hypothetical protein
MRRAFSSPDETASLAGGPQKFAQRAMITATCVPGLPYTVSGSESFHCRAQRKQIDLSLAGKSSSDTCSVL